MESVEQYIKQIVNKNIPVFLTAGKVKQINTDVCDIERAGLPDLYDVRMHAVTDVNADYMRITPKVGSYVLVAIIDNKEEEAFIVAYSEIDKIELRGNALGGLVISQKIADEVNEIKQDLNNLKSAFSAWVVAPSDGGAALKTATATWYGNQLVPVNTVDLENEKIKHG